MTSFLFVLNTSYNILTGLILRQSPKKKEAIKRTIIGDHLKKDVPNTIHEIVTTINKISVCIIFQISFSKVY